MKQRIVVGLTLLFLVGLSAFVSTTVIQNQQKNAFEDLQLTSDSSPNPDASATTTSTPNPCASPSATATTTAGTSPSPSGSSESGVAGGGAPTPCPSPSPGDGTSTATATATATATINPTATANTTATATIGITPKPIGTRNVTATPTGTPTATPIPCPTQDEGSYTDPKCETVKVVLRYRVHDKDPGAPANKPRMRLNPTEYPINGRIDDVKVRFYCDDLVGVVKDVDERGVASVSKADIGCALTQVKAKVLKYLTDDDAPNQIPRKQTTRMYQLYFRDFDTSDLRDQVGNYIGTDNDIHVTNDIGLVARGASRERKILGIAPAVGGIAKLEGDNATTRTMCFSYLYVENLSSNFTCTDMQTQIRVRTDAAGWYMFGTSRRPWDDPSKPALNNLDDKLNFGKFITLVHERGFNNVFVTAQNVQTSRWLDFEKLENNPKPLIGRYGEGVAGKERTQWNRKDCGCQDKNAEILAAAQAYIYGARPLPHPGFSPCSYFTTTVLKDAGTFSRVENACIRLNAVLSQAARQGVIKQLTPQLPSSWAPYNRVNIDIKELGLTPGDVIVFTTDTGGNGQNHAVIYGGKKNGRNTILHSTARTNRAIQRGFEPTNGWLAHTYLSGARPAAGEYKFWSTFSFSCWDGTKLPLN